MSTPTPEGGSAVTVVSDFLADLDGGQFERMLSIAASQCAAAAIDHSKNAEVVIKFTFQRLKGTQQVDVKHDLKFVKPTADGKSSEHATRSTVMHVGKYGKLTIVPESQTQMFTRDGQPNNKD